MDKCTECDKFNALADENENILREYNLLKYKYDRYDMICYELFFGGLCLGVIICSFIWLVADIMKG